jgi:hypothetical protein
MMLTTLALLATLPTAQADEGMWLPEQLPKKAAELKDMGLEIDAAQLADPMGQPLGSIVTLGFCSAAFVSPDGLIATNHHCVAGYLGYLSDAENDRNKDGYLAATQADEAWVGPGSEVQVVQKISDVTDRVNAGVKRRTKDLQREAIVSKNTKAIVADCEADRPDVQCRVASYYGGAEYRLIEKRRLKDVRLVYAPPDSVGAYGGEIDNWMWPRHSGDFALLRAYVAPDGSTAENAEDNVPYQPPHHLEVNPEGANPGDFVMVAGYPGRTYRFKRVRSMQFSRDVAYPFSIGLSEEMRAILVDHSERSDEAKARLTPHIGYIDNGLKYRQGMLDGFSGSDVVTRKEAAEEALMKWVAADKKRSNRYGPVFAEMDAMADESERTYKSESVSRWMLGIDLLSAAYAGWRWACEQEKPDLERDRGYQDRDREKRIRRMERMDKTMWIESDRDVMKLLLEKLSALPADERPQPVLDWVAAQGGIDEALEVLHKDPALAKTENRVALLDMDRATLAKSSDPWVQLAIALDSYNAPLRERDRTRKGANLRLQPLYIEALRASTEGELYPDANSTLRITVGHVKGYSPQDGLVALPQTTLAGMVAKNGDAPFDTPQRFLDAAAKAGDSKWKDADLGDVPVDFLTTLDTTGGNSGSATLDARGRFIGLIFDGNYEAMSADWVFNDEMTRSIHVDVRYLLWTLDEVEGATRLLEEMGVGADSFSGAQKAHP